MKFSRACGVLLHPTSLPGRFGIGDLGPAAHRYLEWLASAGVGWWQLLPLNPTGPDASPYGAVSTSAGNPLLISPEALIADGLLEWADFEPIPASSASRVDFAAVSRWKDDLLHRAWENFSSRPIGDLPEELVSFRQGASSWLGTYALFAALLRAHGGAPWWEWPRGLAMHDAGALAAWRREHPDEVGSEELRQLFFARQWAALRRHAGELGIRFLGDLPIYLSRNSAEVWAERELFQLDADGQPTAVAGVPPDYFSEDGQLWGNPLYEWEALRRTGYRWWIERVRRTFELVDAVRLDHFRGFAQYWSVPAGEKTAIGGRWVDGPGRELFDAVRADLGDLPLVAEDLGVITEDVVALRDALDLPGMAVLQFGFAPEPRSLFLPYNHRANQVVYTGTHDNNTTVGWYRDEAGEGERDFARRYLATDGREINWDLIRAALASVADLAVIPHQDIAGVGSEGRMNTPSMVGGNWAFRIEEWMLSEWHRVRLAELVWLYGRDARSARRP